MLFRSQIAVNVRLFERRVIAAPMPSGVEHQGVKQIERPIEAAGERASEYFGS